MLALWNGAGGAPRAPSSASASSRSRRERTSAYSAITKNALTRTSSPVRMMKRSFTDWLLPAAPASGRLHQRPAWPRAPSSLGSPSPLSCYFGMGRRRSCSDRGTVAAAPAPMTGLLRTVAPSSGAADPSHQLQTVWLGGVDDAASVLASAISLSA